MVKPPLLFVMLMWCWYRKPSSQTHASPVLILFMEEILHQLIGSLSHFSQGFIHPKWCRILSINSMIQKPILKFLHMWVWPFYRPKPRLFWFAQWRPVPFPALNGREKKTAKAIASCPKKETLFLGGWTSKEFEILLSTFLSCFLEKTAGNAGPWNKQLVKYQVKISLLGP